MENFHKRNSSDHWRKKFCARLIKLNPSAKRWIDRKWWIPLMELISVWFSCQLLFNYSRNLLNKSFHAWCLSNHCSTYLCTLQLLISSATYGTTVPRENSSCIFVYCNCCCCSSSLTLLLQFKVYSQSVPLFWKYTEWKQFYLFVCLFVYLFIIIRIYSVKRLDVVYLYWKGCRQKWSLPNLRYIS
jgi:hypothetical protein